MDIYSIDARAIIIASEMNENNSMNASMQQEP